MLKLFGNNWQNEKFFGEKRFLFNFEAKNVDNLVETNIDAKEDGKDSEKANDVEDDYEKLKSFLTKDEGADSLKKILDGISEKYDSKNDQLEARRYLMGKIATAGGVGGYKMDDYEVKTLFKESGADSVQENYDEKVKSYQEQRDEAINDIISELKGENDIYNDVTDSLSGNDSEEKQDKRNELMKGIKEGIDEVNNNDFFKENGIDIREIMKKKGNDVVKKEEGGLYSVNLEKLKTEITSIISKKLGKITLENIGQERLSADEIKAKVDGVFKNTEFANNVKSLSESIKDGGEDKDYISGENLNRFKEEFKDFNEYKENIDKEFDEKSLEKSLNEINDEKVLGKFGVELSKEEITEIEEDENDLNKKSKNVLNKIVDKISEKLDNANEKIIKKNLLADGISEKITKLLNRPKAKNNDINYKTGKIEGGKVEMKKHEEIIKNFFKDGGVDGKTAFKYNENAEMIPNFDFSKVMKYISVLMTNLGDSFSNLKNIQQQYEFLNEKDVMKDLNETFKDTNENKALKDLLNNKDLKLTSDEKGEMLKDLKSYLLKSNGGRNNEKILSEKDELIGSKSILEKLEEFYKNSEKGNNPDKKSKYEKLIKKIK